MKRKAVSDYQDVAGQYGIGDLVSIPLHGISLGRVTAVMQRTGYADVQTAYGNIRVPVEDLMRQDADKSKFVDDFVDDTLDTWERQRSRKERLASQVADAYYNRRTRKLAVQAVDMREQGLSEMETYDRLFDENHEQFADDEIKKAVTVAYPSERMANFRDDFLQEKRQEALRDVEELQKNRRYNVTVGSETAEVSFDPRNMKYDIKFPEGSVVVKTPSSGMTNIEDFGQRRLGQLASKVVKKIRHYKEAKTDAYSSKSSAIKEALYWKEKGRRYTPTYREVEKGEFECPKCHICMEKATYKKYTKLYACPDCLWMICPSEMVPKDKEDEVKDDEDRVDFFKPNDPVLKAIVGDE